MEQTTINVRMNEEAFDSPCNGFDAELYARDPYFDRATQAELARRARDMDASRNIVSKTWEELEAMEND